MLDYLQIDDPVFSKRVSHSVQHRLTAPVINLIAAGALIALLWPVAAPHLLLVWFSVQFTINLARLVFLGSPGGSPPEMLRWARCHTVAAVLAGATWGALSLVLIGLPLAYQAVALLVAGGMYMGALPMLAVLPRVYTYYLVAVLGPLALGQLASADFLQIIIGLLTLMTMVSLWRTGQQLGWTFNDNFRMQTMLEALARHDDLTGITNRRGFDERLLIEWQRAIRSGESLSLAVIDIDDFKLFNDRYGHLAGDKCLRAVAAALAGALLRASDMLARYGGEEFVALLPTIGENGARVVAERMRCKVDSLRYPHASSTTGDHVTVSIGLASIRPEQGSSQHDFLQCADEALYLAKAAGKNRVAFKCPDGLPTE